MKKILLACTASASFLFILSAVFAAFDIATINDMSFQIGMFMGVMMGLPSVMAAGNHFSGVKADDTKLIDPKVWKYMIIGIMVFTVIGGFIAEDADVMGQWMWGLVAGLIITMILGSVVFHFVHQAKSSSEGSGEARKQLSKVKTAEELKKKYRKEGYEIKEKTPASKDRDFYERVFKEGLQRPIGLQGGQQQPFNVQQTMPASAELAEEQGA
ncbi:MAG: hypothetical protein ABIG20_02035 [archaeon]